MISKLVIPKDSKGHILWSTIPGFIDWFKKEASLLSNGELHDLLLEKYGVDTSNAVVTTLRLRWGCNMSKEARKRAFVARDVKIKEKNKVGEVKISPEEKLEQDLLRQQVQRLTSRQLFYDVVGQKMLTSLHSLPPITPAIIKKQPKFKESLHEESMVLLISDVQAGMRVDSKESGGLGSFNSEILLNYIDVLKNAVLRVREYHPNTRNLHIFWLGDIVEGEDIYGGQLREIDANVIQQVMFCWNHFTKFQLDLANEFEEVVCSGVIGNHGRIGKKGEHSPLSNFDYLLYKMWEERLKSCKNIKWTVSESWWQVTDVQGWKFLLVHGDDSGQSFAGIPFYAVARHKARYREMFKNVLDEEMDFDFMTIGHHCLPDRARILTKNGFKNRKEISIGDDVLSYDFLSDKLKWAPIQAINKYFSEPLYGLESKSFYAEATPEHKWAVTYGTKINDKIYSYKKLHSTDSLKSSDSLIISAIAEEGNSLCSARDAAILGWLVTDGHMRWSCRAPHFTIGQVKEIYIKKLQKLLGEDAMESVNSNGLHTFYIHNALSWKLLNYLNIESGPFTKEQIKSALPSFIMTLSRAARQNMLKAFLQAEGDGHYSFSQNKGPILEAFLILATLEGRRVGKLVKMISGFGGEGVYRAKLLKHRVVSAKHLAIYPIEPGAVWCPTTKYGTWVAELDGQVFITGNSAAAEFQYIIMNGSWPGGTELSLKKMQMADVPIQKLFAVHEDHGVTWTRNIHLRPLRLSFNRL